MKTLLNRRTTIIDKTYDKKGLVLTESIQVMEELIPMDVITVKAKADALELPPLDAFVCGLS